jgi:hypothetical protein
MGDRNRGGRGDVGAAELIASIISRRPTRTSSVLESANCRSRIAKMREVRRASGCEIQDESKIHMSPETIATIVMIAAFIYGLGVMLEVRKMN